MKKLFVPVVPVSNPAKEADLAIRILKFQWALQGEKIFCSKCQKSRNVTITRIERTKDNFERIMSCKVCGLELESLMDGG